MPRLFVDLSCDKLSFRTKCSFKNLFLENVIFLVSDFSLRNLIHRDNKDSFFTGVPTVYTKPMF